MHDEKTSRLADPPLAPPLALALLGGTETMYLCGDTGSGVVTISPVPALGVGSIWTSPLDPNGNFRFAIDSGADKRFLNANSDGTVSLGTVSAEGIEWIVLLPFGSGPYPPTTYTLQAVGGPQDAKYLTATGGKVGFSSAASQASNFSILPAFDKAAITALIAKFGPIIFHHPAEQYKMCSVEWFLQHATLYNERTKKSIAKPTIDQLPITMDPADKQLYSLNMTKNAKPGAPETAQAYVHALVGFSHIDLQFWRFYAYNGPGTCWAKQTLLVGGSSGTASLAPLGEHWGDWELTVIRIDTVSKQPIGVWLAQHNSGTWYGPDQIKTLERHGDQFVFYASQNGHATYPAVGENPSEVHDYSFWPFTIKFQLENYTGKGDRFDSSVNYQIVATDLVADAPATPNWVRYPYRWGPVETSSAISPDSVNQILYAVFGPLGFLGGALGFGYMAAILASAFKQDDVNGPEGPITKVSTWAGSYS